MECSARRGIVAAPVEGQLCLRIVVRPHISCCGMVRCGELCGVACPVALPGRIEGGDGFPESADPGARLATGEQDHRLLVAAAPLREQIGLDKQGPCGTIERDPEGPVVDRCPLDRRAHIVEFRLVAVQPDGLIQRPVFLVSRVQQIEHGGGHALLRSVQLLAGR